MRPYDYLIVGSGIFGAVFAYLAKRAGKRCVVIDKRPHVGGNVYCAEQHGIIVHQYGPHIFHTSSKEVWDFVNSLVPFNRFTYMPMAHAEGKMYNLPFNMNTFYQMWGCKTPAEATLKLEQERQSIKAELQAQGIDAPRNLEEQALFLVGRDIYDKLIKGYTEKQWGRPCSELPAFIINRLPVRLTYDNNYFNDAYQGIPIGGYNKLIEALLDGVECHTNEDFFARRAYWESMAQKVVFTGQIDEYYNYCYGKLQYRTVRFEHELHHTPNWQGCAAINYTDCQVPYTRSIEHKHFEHFGAAVYDSPCTIVTKEYSSEWSEGCEPFYPVNDATNNALAARYKALAEQENTVIFGGRLAEYKYYDMAPLIENVLHHPEVQSWAH